MTFSFYHSLTTLPRDLNEAAAVLRLGAFQRLVHLELPAAMISLVWNSMMSFGGSWFFLAASEAITVVNRTVYLPGLGSYMAVAVARGDVGAQLWALGAMVLVIVAVDQLFWRPIVAWAQKFRLEQAASLPPASSFILTLLRRSALVRLVEARVLLPALDAVEVFFARYARRSEESQLLRRVGGGAVALVGVALAAWAVRYLVLGAHLVARLGGEATLRVLLLGLWTLMRVAASTAFGALWTVPVGVYIGMSPRLARIAQPIVQIAASFPANMLFPFVIALYLRWHLSLAWGSIPLMMLGTQWYLLFNVIAGAMSIPSDLREAARIFGLGGWSRWRDLVLPAVFPSLVTGAVTAAGGAWNASIVAEVVAYRGRELTAPGLGAYITAATAQGAPDRVILGIAAMSLYVVALNRLVWRRLYLLAERKYHIE